MADTIAEARKKKSNKTCADCGIKSVTYASTKFNIFLCTDCASAHLHFSFKTKGLSESHFTDIEALNLAKVGNLKSNKHYLARYKESDFPKLTVRSDGSDRQTLVDLKYRQKRWIAKDSSPVTPTPAALAMPKRTAAAVRRPRGSSGSTGAVASSEPAAVAITAEAIGRQRGNSGGRRGSARSRVASASGSATGKLQTRMGIASGGRSRGSSASKPGRLTGPRSAIAGAPVHTSRGEGASLSAEAEIDLFDSGAGAGSVAADDAFGFPTSAPGDASGGEEAEGEDSTGASGAGGDDDFGFDDAPVPASVPAPAVAGGEDDGFGFDNPPSQSATVPSNDDGFGFDDAPAPAPAPTRDDDGFGFDVAPAPASAAVRGDDDGFGFDDAPAPASASGDLGDLFSAPAPAPSPDQQRGRARAASREAGKKILGSLGDLYEAAAAERAQAAAAHAAALQQQHQQHLQDQMQRQHAFAAGGYAGPGAMPAVGAGTYAGPFPHPPDAAGHPYAAFSSPGGPAPQPGAYPPASHLPSGRHGEAGVPVAPSLSNNPFGADDTPTATHAQHASGSPDPFASILDMDAAASTFQPAKPGSRAQAFVTPSRVPAPSAVPVADLFGDASAPAPAGSGGMFGLPPAAAPAPQAQGDIMGDLFGDAPVASAPVPASAASSNPFDMF